MVSHMIESSLRLHLPNVILVVCSPDMDCTWLLLEDILALEEGSLGLDVE